MSTPQDFTMENFKTFWNSMQNQILPKYSKVEDLGKDLRNNVTKEDIIAILGYTPDDLPDDQEQMLNNIKFIDGQLCVKDEEGNWVALITNNTEEKNQYATEEDIENLFKDE